MTNKARKQLQELYCEWCPKDCQGLTKVEKIGCLASSGFATELESLGYVLKDLDQSLPKPSIYVPSESDCETNEVNLISRHYYLTAQQDMLRAGWIKIE